MVTWGWLLQRISGVLIFVFLGTHLWVLHYLDLGQSITFQRVQERLNFPFFIVIDLGLLAAALYHALYGIRGILLEYQWVRSPKLPWALLGVGMVGFAVGTYAIMGFLS